MPLLVILVALGLLLPRLTIVLLWLLTGWFSGLFATWLIPLLGFIFMPYTLLWYGVVANLFGGVWGPIEVVGLILSILADLSASGWGYGHYHTHYRVVEEVHEE